MCELNLLLLAAPLGQRPIWQKPLPRFKDRITVIRSWLDDCGGPGSDHRHCRRPRTSTLPTRLLYVGQSGRWPTKDVRLVLTDTLSTKTKYTTLSHCWGPPTVKPPLKTTRPLMKKFLKNISFSALPRNYRHAIAMTRKLGIDYIWIDSLCIIQGDAKDWEIESARMSTYYRGSYLTIGAAASTNCHGGFIGDLDAADYSTWAAGRHSRGTILMRKETVSVLGLAGSAVTAQNPLLNRGWVLQEQVLSPRTVFCTGNGQLLWQCHSLFTSEDATVHTYRFSSLQRAVNCAFDMSDKRIASLLWWQWVTDYSGRQLTFGTDRAPAIAGLVDFYQNQTGHTPLLGLWRETIGYDLTWFIPSDNGSSAPKETRFPSWSWLSHLDATDTTKLLSRVNIAHEQTWGSMTTEVRVASCSVDCTCFCPPNHPLVRDAFIADFSARARPTLHLGAPRCHARSRRPRQGRRAPQSRRRHRRRLDEAPWPILGRQGHAPHLHSRPAPGPYRPRGETR